MMYCVYIKDGVVISDILPCEKTIVNLESSVMVQTSTRREVLEKTISMLKAKDIRLSVESIQRIREYKANNQWFKIQQEIEQTTGVSLCCQGKVEKFIEPHV